MERQWKGNTKGTPWMHRMLIASFKVMNLRFIYAGLAVAVVPCCMLFGHKGYLAQYRYFRQRLGYNRVKAFVAVGKNHYRFGQVIIDRFYMYSGGSFDFTLEHHERYRELEHKEGSFLILSSHTGNYEIAGYTLSARLKRLNALVYSGEAITIMQNRKKELEKNNIAMIPVSDDMSHLFMMSNALDNGEILSIPADRILGSPRYLKCDFMGAKAKFPLGPFALAVQRDLPVLAVQVMKDNVKRYRIIIAEIAPSSDAVKPKDKMQSLAQAYARNLEATLKRYPHQWFNYYDFWK